MPKKVTFTGLEFHSNELLRFRYVPGPYPASWGRVILQRGFENQRSRVAWILENVDGRFGMVADYPCVTLYFENTSDAILIKMLDSDEHSNDDSF